jgi:transposase
MMRQTRGGNRLGKDILCILSVTLSLHFVTIAEVPELGSITDKQASSLVGVAPLNRDSGQWRGQRTIHGGRRIVRRSLFMPALCCTIHNPILRDFYRSLIQRNKPQNLAIPP